MHILSPEAKLKAVREVLSKEGSLSYIAKKYRCSRQSLASWVRKFEQSKYKSARVFASKYKKGKNHPKSIPWKVEKALLDLVINEPDLGVLALCRELTKQDFKISTFGIWKILTKYELQTKELRHRFALVHPAKTVFAHKLSPAYRVKAIEQYLEGKSSVTGICKIWKVSRPTFYAWLARWREASQENKVSSLIKRYKKGHEHHRSIGVDVREVILNIVCNNPEYSVHKIYATIPKVASRPIASHEAIQNLLFREGLNTKERRIAFAPEYGGKSQVAVAPLYEPEKPLYRLRQLISPFKTVPKLLVTNPPLGLLLSLFVSLPFFVLFLLARLIISTSGQPPIGLFLASAALLFGLFFFLYSAKYYLTILMVLKLVQGGVKNPTTSINPNPLLLNLDQVKLENRPFVSIHVAVFNEKKVVERLITACLTQKWMVQNSSQLTVDSSQTGQDSEASVNSEPITDNQIANFEVIIADDSTDGTTEMVLKQLKSDGRKLEKLSVHGSQSSEADCEVFVSTKPGLPTIKLIHRFSRSGFKGAALQKALEHTDSRAQYVTIFDSDFVPYPDTIEQFMKVFQEVCGGLHKVNESKVAVVQGYQWHVLNKSENWVTRGVRAEYAGSYVVERSGEEIYGGLKQIAGSVYTIRADVLRNFGWGTSITEDFELTLRLYEAGYKVVFTPHIQAPAEAVSTIRKLIRQRMRWAEGASHNIKLMFGKVMQSSNLSLVEKAEFLYLSPYYLQAAFFVVGTFAWFFAELVLGARLPFWTAALGWSLVFTNMLSLPLMNIVGLFLEESNERDYMGILSFVALSYIVVPFQAYAAIKGFIEPSEGPWFRTPKTGTITDVFERTRFSKFFGQLLGKKATQIATEARQLVQTPVHSLNFFDIRASFHSPIRPRSVRLIGNLSLVAIIAITILMSIFAPLIPMVSPVSAQERVFGSLNGMEDSGAQISSQNSREEVKNPRVVGFRIDDERVLEYIFHPEPRVRTKFDKAEIELRVLGSESLGNAMPRGSISENGQYIYEEIFENVDLRLTPSLDKLQEEIVLKENMEFENIDYSLKTVGLVVVLRDNQVYFAPENGGNPLFTFTKPYMYEEANPESKNFAIEYKLEKEPFGWNLKKVLGEEGRRWLSDPARVFPVVIDPTQVTSTIQTGIATDDSDYGQQQRKIVWANGATNGDAWYAVYEDAGDVSYEKCVPSVDGCEIGTDWTDATNISGGDNPADNRQPSLWWENDQKRVWITWADNTADNAEFRYLDVDASDSGTLSAICTGPDQGNHNPTTWLLTIAVADSAGSTDDIFITYVDTSTNTNNNIYRIDVNSSIASTCTAGTEVTWNSILANSGVDASDRPIALAIGDDLHLIFQDGTTLRHSVSNNDGGTEWDRADTDITGADTDNTSINYSAVTDGTGIWVIIDQGTSGVDLWTCDPCSSSGTWTNAADPWSSQSADITEVSLAYDSATDDIFALVLRSDANEAVIMKSTDTTTISWVCNSGECNLGTFGNVALEDISSTMSADSVNGIGFVVEDGTNSELEFSTLPERTLFLLIFAPLLPKIFGKLKRRFNIR